MQKIDRCPVAQTSPAWLKLAVRDGTESPSCFSVVRKDHFSKSYTYILDLEPINVGDGSGGTNLYL